MSTAAVLLDEVVRLDRLVHQIAAQRADAVLAFARASAAELVDGGMVEPERIERDIAAQVGLACRVSPTEARKRVRMARDLHDGLDQVQALFAAGELSEYAVVTITRATAHLSRDERAEVDQALAERDVASLGVRRIGDLARTSAAEVAPEAFAARARAARKGRYVSLRPADDGMAYLTAHLPAEQAIACMGALAKQVTEVAISPDPVIRGRGEIMADTLVERITGQATADEVPVEVQVLIPLEALLDPAGPLPAELRGHGPIPTERVLPHAAAIRRLLTRDGIVIGGESRRRTFSGPLAAFIRARDGNRCTAPYCDAPIRHIDHIERWADGGRTSFDNGRGLCEFHNHIREHPGWRTKVVEGKVVTSTPTGHEYAARIGTTASRPRMQSARRHAA